MSTISFLSPSAERVSVPIKSGTSVMEAAIAHGVEGIEAQCYGAGICGTCHVMVPENVLAKLPLPSEWEADMLEALPLAGARSRLACQIAFADELAGAEFEIPERQDSI